MLTNQAGIQPTASAFTKIVLPSCPPEILNLPDLTKPPPPFPSQLLSDEGGIKIATLLELAGQLFELCKGEFGSNLVVERLTGGREEESRLLWKELGLPTSLPSITSSYTSRQVSYIYIHLVIYSPLTGRLSLP